MILEDIVATDCDYRDAEQTEEGVWAGRFGLWSARPLHCWVRKYDGDIEIQGNRALIQYHFWLWTEFTVCSKPLLLWWPTPKILRLTPYLILWSHHTMLSFGFFFNFIGHRKLFMCRRKLYNRVLSCFKACLHTIVSKYLGLVGYH